MRGPAERVPQVNADTSRPIALSPIGERERDAASAVLRLAEAVRDPDQAAPSAPPEPIKKRFPWWAPSMSDLFVAAFFVWTFLAGTGGWTALLQDADSGWHIRTGEVILETH